MKINKHKLLSLFSIFLFLSLNTITYASSKNDISIDLNQKNKFVSITLHNNSDSKKNVDVFNIYEKSNKNIKYHKKITLLANNKKTYKLKYDCKKYKNLRVKVLYNNKELSSKVLIKEKDNTSESDSKSDNESDTSESDSKSDNESDTSESDSKSDNESDTSESNSKSDNESNTSESDSKSDNESDTSESDSKSDNESDTSESDSKSDNESNTSESDSKSDNESDTSESDKKTRILSKEDSDLSNAGITLSELENFYYKNVKNDKYFQKSDDYFYNAITFYNRLIQIKNEKGLFEAIKFYKEWEYDLWDPNFPKKNNKNYIDGHPDYGDETIDSKNGSHAYAKDSMSPFHVNPTPDIEPVNATLIEDEDGNNILVNNDENVFSNLEKSVSYNDQPRNYTIHLKGKTHLDQVVPAAMIFQIQTSWQMFDLSHANDKAALVNREKINKEILSLYDIKHTFIDFANWIEEQNKFTNSKGSSVLIGITNFQHGGTYSMMPNPYYTNNMEVLKEGLYGWDSFGDCEHIHYSNKELLNAAKALTNPSYFYNWTDKNGKSIYSVAKAHSIIIGGACEAADLNKSYLANVSKLQGVEDQYGIRTNIPVNSYSGNVSWLDKSEEDGSFEPGKYFPGVVTREQLLNTLKEIYNGVQSVGKINGVTITDTITKEFDVKEDKIVALVDGKEVTINTNNLKIEKNSDGTTKVSYTFDSVPNNSNVELKIGIKAKDDYLGSNNVYTNKGKANISWNGRIDEDRVFEQEFPNQPKVNVPIQFSTSNGGNKNVSEGETVDLGTIDSQKIVDNIEELIKKYPQISGKLIYQWKDENGNLIGEPKEISIPDRFDSIYDGDFPDLNEDIIAHDIPNDGKKYYLNVTFEPLPVSTDTTGNGINSVTHDGFVTLLPTSFIDIILSKKNESGSVMSGVKFELYSSDSNWQKKELIQSKETNELGTITFDKLKIGNYLIYEIKTQDGYILPREPWKLEILDDGTYTIKDSNNKLLSKEDNNYVIINKRKVPPLPDTGGKGIYPFIIFDILILLLGIKIYKFKKEKLF